jgi:hypothetical protein
MPRISLTVRSIYTLRNVDDNADRNGYTYITLTGEKSFILTFTERLRAGGCAEKVLLLKDRKNKITAVIKIPKDAFFPDQFDL